MRSFLLVPVLALGLSLSAQQASPAASVSPATHQAAVELVEASGIRTQLATHEDDMISSGKEAMVRHDPTINAAFYEEWGKRMKARFPLDELVAATVHVYESHFTEAELHALAQAAKDRAAGKEPAISPELKTKVSSSMIAVQSEIMGSFTQIGSKLGGEIGEQLQKEHPEWFKAAPASPAKP